MATLHCHCCDKCERRRDEKQTDSHKQGHKELVLIVASTGMPNRSQAELIRAKRTNLASKQTNQQRRSQNRGAQTKTSYEETRVSSRLVNHKGLQGALLIYPQVWIKGSSQSLSTVFRGEKRTYIWS